MRCLLSLLLAAIGVAALAQPTYSLSQDMRSLEVRATGCELRTPVLSVGGDGCVDIDFDMAGHGYRRIIYKVEHWNAGWTAKSDLLESEYMEGFDGSPIEDYEESEATAWLYTHYHLAVPNDDVTLRLSGNYRVWLIDEEEGDTLASAGFMVLENGVVAKGSMTARTDKDIRGRHQQLELEIGYGSVRVVDPQEELLVFAQQNRRWDTRRRLPSPNLRSMSGVGWTHRSELIFDAGNSCHKFEMLDKHNAGMGADHLEYHAPFEHLVLLPVERAQSFYYDEDNAGAFVIRNTHGDADIEGEYRFVHFAFDAPRLPEGSRLYVVGDMTHGCLLPRFELTWNDDLRLYECSTLLKEGYYEYRILHTDGHNVATALTEGDFWETKNEYEIMVYNRPRGGRYDRLVGYFRL